MAVRVAFSMCTYSFFGSTPAIFGVRNRHSNRRDCSSHMSADSTHEAPGDLPFKICGHEREASHQQVLSPSYA